MDLITYYVLYLLVVNCGKVQPPLNGSIIGDDTTFQKSITYQCDPGFELKGSRTVICQSDGKWSQKSKCEGNKILQKKNNYRCSSDKNN